jgi:hypothetical protein
MIFDTARYACSDASMAGLDRRRGDNMSAIKMKSDGTVITSLRMPFETWQRLKLQAVAERSDMRTIILRGVEGELSAASTAVPGRQESQAR